MRLRRKNKTNLQAFSIYLQRLSLFLKKKLHFTCFRKQSDKSRNKFAACWALPLCITPRQSSGGEILWSGKKGKKIQEKKKEAKEEVLVEVGVSRAASVTGDAEWQLSGRIRLMQDSTQWVKERRRAATTAGLCLLPYAFTLYIHRQASVCSGGGKKITLFSVQIWDQLS